MDHRRRSSKQIPNVIISLLRFTSKRDLRHKKSSSLKKMSELLAPKDYERLLPVIKFLEENESIKPSEAEALLGKSPATSRRYLKTLVDAKVLEQHGKANNTIYVKVSI